MLYAMAFLTVDVAILRWLIHELFGGFGVAVPTR
jgi:hypothetical protein